MGPDAAKNFVPAQDLIGEYLSTRIPEEFDTYNQEVILTDIITKRALSNEVITPGKLRSATFDAGFYDEMWRNRGAHGSSPTCAFSAKAYLQRLRVDSWQSRRKM